MKSLSRRKFFWLAGAAGAALIGWSAPLGTQARQTAEAPQASGSPMSGLPLVGSASSGQNGSYLELALTAAPASVNILPGQATRVWQYRPQVLRGDPAAVQFLPSSYLGPVLRLRKGQRVRVHLHNELSQGTIIHWHGMLVPHTMDGHPHSAIGPGQTFTYDFEVLNRAGTYWYHPHPHGVTGPQVYAGLAGMLIVSDDEEAAAGLPSGEQDLPVIIQDRTFDANNQFVYQSGSGMGMGMMGMSWMTGFLGNRILVNGRPDAVFSLSTRAYRLRLLNASNARMYKLAWRDGAPLTVIGSDGGLLEKPVVKPYVTLGPGERADLWVDLSGRRVGEEITLQSLAFSGAGGEGGAAGGMGMGMGMRGGRGGGRSGGNLPNGSLPNGAAFPVLRLRVDRMEKETLKLPQRLSLIERHQFEGVTNLYSPRSFSLSMGHMQWLLNGRVFEMTGVANNEIVKLGALEAWEFVNQHTAMGAIAHPMHIHGVQFQVVQRELLAPALKAGWDSVREGYLDEGWKDTVVVMPGERVMLLARFEHPGLFVYHCHNLEHEDMGMMRNYRVNA